MISGSSESGSCWHVHTVEKVSKDMSARLSRLVDSGLVPTQAVADHVQPNSLEYMSAALQGQAVLRM